MSRMVLVLSMTVAIFLAPFATVAPSDSVYPLFELLNHISQDAKGIVTLNDYAAVTTQSAVFTSDLAPDHPNRLFLSFATLATPHWFDRNILFEFPDGAIDALGFSIFEIDQMAGWGVKPDIGLAMTGVARQPQRIKSALLDRGFGEAAIGPHVVWHRQDDFQADATRRLEEPFAGMDGTSQRFSIVGESLMFSRSWQVMRHMIGAAPGLDSDSDSAAILWAGYQFADAGTLVSAYLMPGQPARPSIPADAADPLGLPGLPEYSRYGVLLWQNGATMTGAIAIPYTSPEAAQTALANFSSLLEVVQSPSVRRPMKDFLPKERRFEVIETEESNVLVLAFEKTHIVEQPISLMTFVGNPLQRLFDLIYRNEIGLLIGP